MEKKQISLIHELQLKSVKPEAPGELIAERPPCNKEVYLQILKFPI